MIRELERRQPLREHVEQDEENETEIVRESLITSNEGGHLENVPPP